METPLIKTTVGLPNTCSRCGGKYDQQYWFVVTEDEARAGGGICEDCAFPAPVPASKKKAEKAPAVAPAPDGSAE